MPQDNYELSVSERTLEIITHPKNKVVLLDTNAIIPSRFLNDTYSCADCSALSREELNGLKKVVMESINLLEYPNAYVVSGVTEESKGFLNRFSERLKFFNKRERSIQRSYHSSSNRQHKLFLYSEIAEIINQLIKKERKKELKLEDKLLFDEIFTLVKKVSDVFGIKEPKQEEKIPRIYREDRVDHRTDEEIVGAAFYIALRDNIGCAVVSRDDHIRALIKISSKFVHYITFPCSLNGNKIVLYDPFTGNSAAYGFN